MQWSPGDRSNIEDMRGRSGFRAVPIGIGGFLLLISLSWATGTDFLSLLGTQSDPSQTAGTSGQVTATPQEERMVDFVDAVAKDATEQLTPRVLRILRHGIDEIDHPFLLRRRCDLARCAGRL